ncbi:hypothetical protein D1BOALGB6SA_3619 [Olavius sp. associated proteobacterium Delta 1]|nr:hypothetical protein D1BOALGB6SA_3619 [Olavius sp. associated proteobacterium Delta 1]
MNEFLEILDILAIITWLGGGNYVIYRAIKRQQLSFAYYFWPFPILKGKDWLKILGLLILTFLIVIVRVNISD